MKIIKRAEMSLLPFLFILNVACKPDTGISSIREEIENVLVNNILHVWYPRIVDTTHGGFYSNFDAEWNRMPDQEKFIVTQARDIWTASQAARLYPDDQDYILAADHGFRFLKDTMWDRQYGGFYSYYPKNAGNDLSQYKLAYGNAFAIYALAAYYEVTKNPEALELAKRTFRWLDENSHDTLYGGYYNVLSREGHSVLSAGFKVPEENYWKSNAVYKDYNSSIHLLEAFSELYKVWNDSLPGCRLQEMLAIVRDTMVSQYGYLHLYFHRDWQPLLFVDSAENVQRRNLDLDHVSFGHDIETAYLILEASAALGNKHDTLTHKVAKKLVDHTLLHGIDPENSGIYDAGMDVNGKDSIVIVIKSKNWWSQSEGMNAMLLFSRLYPEESVYWLSFMKQWEYIKDYCIDREHGDWYMEGLDNSPDAKNLAKASIWKGNYHTARAMINCMYLLPHKK
jgi:mannobiose 2-epimerase